MKRFVFSLEKVLDFKQQTLDIKKNELALLQMKLIEVEKQIEELNCKFSQSNAKMVEEMQQGLTPNDILIYKAYFTSINDKIKKLLSVKKQMAEVIAQKKQDILSINSEISGLEKLKDKQWTQYLKNRQKGEELAIDEFVSQARSWAN